MDLLYCVSRSKPKEVQLELGKFARLSWEIFFHRVDCHMCLYVWELKAVYFLRG